MSWEVVFVWIEGHPGLASWVQAFGSVAAILIAVWISNTESRIRKAAEKHARKSAITRCQWVLANCGDIVERITKSLVGTELTESFVRANIARLDTLHDEIRELAYGPGMDADIFAAVLNARLGMDRLRYKLQEWLDASDRPSYGEKLLQSHFHSIDEALTKLDKLEVNS